MLLIGQFNYGKRGILDLTHARLFTFESFRRLFEQGGFRVVENARHSGPVRRWCSGDGVVGRTASRADQQRAGAGLARSVLVLRCSSSWSRCHRSSTCCRQRSDESTATAAKPGNAAWRSGDVVRNGRTGRGTR